MLGYLMRMRFVYLGLPYIGCLSLCLVVNLLYFPPAIVFPDEQRFLASAIRLTASGEFWVGTDRAWEMPGTALFFSPAVWLFGPNAAVLPIRLAQSAFLMVQCALVAFTAQRIFDRGAVAFIALCLAALYPFFLYYQGLLLSETLFNTLLLAGIAALYWWRERGAQTDFALFATCLCLTAATYTKATLTILPPLLIAATALTAGATLRRTLTVFVVAACLFIALMSPWWIRNAVLLGAFVPFTTGSAQNLYLGNNPQNSSGGIDWASDVDPAVVARISALPNELERQRAFGKAAFDYIEENPIGFVRTAAKKFVRFWNLVPNATEFRTGLYSVVSAASFGPILLLALVCVVRQRRQWRLFASLYLVIIYFTFVHIVTIASLRYRLPIEPILILLAAEPIAAAFERIHQSRAPAGAVGSRQSPF